MSFIDHLNVFVSNHDGYLWRTMEANECYELVSGRWKSGDWSHVVTIAAPQDEPRAKSVAILYITGGDPNPTDLAEAKAIANRSGLPVAILFGIPNQPLFDRWEDDLIAHTFQQYIDTGDRDWPLLYPMVRAAVRAMDMLQELRYARFVITVASKRGWTTWLAAATGDPRVIGIAPMVIDNLDFPAQMRHQVESWGAYSEQIEDYTSRDLQDQADSERGVELVQMMDPISYVDRIKCPILIINGSNDRYWTVDALSLYWDRMPGTTRCLIVPNAGHLLGDKVRMIETLCAFSDHCSRGQLLPEVSFEEQDGHFEIDAPMADAVRVWAAVADTMDFRDSEWSVVANCSTVVSRPGPLNLAAMGEARYVGPTGEFSLSTPIRVFPAEKA
jgi:PhoPQ-activated pathogenicity-related protein